MAQFMGITVADCRLKVAIPVQAGIIEEGIVAFHQKFPHSVFGNSGIETLECDIFYTKDSK